MKTSLLLSLLLLCGCKPKYSWGVRTVPTTPEEREALACFVQNCAVKPTSLSGDDQDLEDVISTATAKGMEILCAPTLWEWRIESGHGEWTGNWKHLPPPDSDGNVWRGNRITEKDQP